MEEGVEDGVDARRGETALTSRHPRLRRRPALTSKHTSECNPAADPSMSKKSVKDTTRSTHDAGALLFAAINAGARLHRPPQQLGPVCGCSTPLNCTLVTVFYSASLKVANGEAAMHGRCMLGCQTAWIHQRARGSAASISPRLWRSRLILFRSDGLAHAHQGENEERHRQTEYDEGAKDTIALLLGRELGRAVGRAIESISRRQGVGCRWEVWGGGPMGVSSCQFWRTGGTQRAPLVALLLLRSAACLRWNLERALLTESRVQPNPLSMSACSVRWPAAPLAAPGARLRSQEH